MPFSDNCLVLDASNSGCCVRKTQCRASAQLLLTILQVAQEVFQPASSTGFPLYLCCIFLSVFGSLYSALRVNLVDLDLEPSMRSCVWIWPAFVRLSLGVECWVLTWRLYTYSTVIFLDLLVVGTNPVHPFLQCASQSIMAYQLSQLSTFFEMVKLLLAKSHAIRIQAYLC